MLLLGWLSAARDYVREYFDIRHVDQFNQYQNTIKSEDRWKITFNLANSRIDPHARPEAYELGFKIYVLKYFKEELSCRLC